MLRVRIVQIFKDLNITMGKYVLHSYFYSIDMDGVDIILGHSWMDSQQLLLLYKIILSCFDTKKTQITLRIFLLLSKK